MIETLHCQSLWIAPLIARDQDFYVSLYTDALTMACIAEPLSVTAAQRSFAAALRCNQMPTLGRHTWTLTDSQREQIGLLALMRDVADLPGDSAEVGAMIVPSQQNRGFAAVAIAALAGHVFAKLDIARLLTRHSPDNGLANGLMVKLGFERIADGIAPQSSCWQLLRPG